MLSKSVDRDRIGGFQDGRRAESLPQNRTSRNPIEGTLLRAPQKPSPQLTDVIRHSDYLHGVS
jgi:hypothetical protein